MITSGGLGTMGYGLPASIGAKVAQPDALVIDIDGDASFNMTLTELSTAAQFNIGVKVIVLNNEEQGMVTQWQNLFYEDRYAHTHQSNPDFIKLAEAMHVQCRRVEKPADVKDALKWLIETDGPALLEVVTDKKVPVLPMVPTGSGLHEFLVWDEGKFFDIFSSPKIPTQIFHDANFPHSQGPEEERADAQADERSARSIKGVCVCVNNTVKFFFLLCSTVFFLMGF